MDPSPPSSIITIVLLYLMISNVSLHWLGVQNLMPLGSIGTWLAGAKKVNLSILDEVAHHLMIRRRNNFHSMKPCTSHDGVEMGHILDHRELYI